MEVIVVRRARVSSVLLVTACLGVGIAGCRSDFEDLPLALGRSDHGWLVSLEPDEPLEVGLVGSALHPDARWTVAELDESVIELEQQDHEKLSWDLEDFTGDDRATVTLSFLRAVDIGETTLAFELLDDAGERVGIAEFTVHVVENACEVDVGLVANRCGRSDVQQPQGLTELEHGWLVALEPGEQVDSSAITVDGPTNSPADRTTGDWDPDSDESFVSTSTFVVTADELGRARADFSFRAGNRVVDVYSVTFDVVQDACATDSNQSSCKR